MSQSNTSPSGYEKLRASLVTERHVWLVTGVAGFIGSNLLEALLKLDQKVVGLDNFATGHQRNLDEVRSFVGEERWRNFNFIYGDICNLEICRQACDGVEYVLHQAALGSVPRSLIDPIATNRTNVEGFLNMLVAAKDAKVTSFTYAASSSTYGDHPGLPKVEEKIGKPLSPYAVTKYVNELYADVFAKSYRFNTIGLRYFNVFGPRQDPNGAYAAVIPKWIASLIKGEEIYINGDGETSRDFCFIENVIQANFLAACCQNKAVKNQVFNVAVGDRTTLNELHSLLFSELRSLKSNLKERPPIFRDFREGDVRHSLASVKKIETLLGYAATHRLDAGIKMAMPWYLKYLN